MNYEPSQNLINILLNNGFKEMTELRYPEHFQRLINSTYNPHGMKRAFGIGNKVQIIFDYITIVTKDYGNGLFTHKTRLTEDELKSIITYFKLPSQFKLEINKSGKPITDLHIYYNSYKVNSTLKTSNFSRSIVKAYEDVII